MRTRSMSSLIWVLAQIIALGILYSTHAFVPQHTNIQQHSQSQNWRRHHEDSVTHLFSNGGDEDVNMGPEKSRMTDYIAKYLGNLDAKSGKKKKTAKKVVSDNDADPSSFSHLVAIPMDACHELLIELESVQRAILYNCPILVDACIPAASTRLPLLYVQGPTGSTTTTLGVTQVLTKVVRELSEKHLVIRVEDDEDYIDPTIDLQDLNEDGICPFTLELQSLEIDGENNKILSTVAKPNDSRTKRLQAFVHELQTTIEEKHGWKTSFPDDPHPAKQEEAGGFRPRIPFMELPQSMDDNLTRLKAPETEITDEILPFLGSSEGGNGISPIFWCQWWEDTFARKCRLREVGIYPQNAPMAGLVDTSEWSYTKFFMPHETVALPDGNKQMQLTEREFEKYQEDRLMEAQKEMEKEQKNGGVDSKPNGDQPFDGNQQFAEPDLLMTKTRERLEKVYQSSIDEISMDGLVDQVPTDAVSPDTNKEDEENDLELTPVTASPDDFMEDWMKARIQKIVDEPDEESSNLVEKEKQELEAKIDNDNGDDEKPDSDEESNVDFMDDWMKNRIRNIIENRESVKARQQIVKKNKPPIEENPVFNAYKEGRLVPFPEDEETESQQTKKKDLGPYPGRDHFVGFWRMENSPTGFAVAPNTQDSSDNLVLRVDGTTAGGPILDQETKQKAAGGTWKFTEDKETGEVKLRIRLVIPPTKERILEMEGTVRRMNFNNELPMTSRAFGIPELEKRIKESSQGDVDDVLQCDGEVFIEDAVTKKNRENIGTFSISKISGIKDRRNYTITIPKPVRNQD